MTPLDQHCKVPLHHHLLRSPHVLLLVHDLLSLARHKSRVASQHHARGNEAFKVSSNEYTIVSTATMLRIEYDLLDSNVRGGGERLVQSGFSVEASWGRRRGHILSAMRDIIHTHDAASLPRCQQRVVKYPITSHCAAKLKQAVGPKSCTQILPLMVHYHVSQQFKKPKTG